MEKLTDTQGKTSSISKTVDYKDGSSKTVRIRQVENGWIICIDKRFKEGEEWKYEEKEYISRKNPVEDEEEETNEEDVISEVLKSI